MKLHNRFGKTLLALAAGSLGALAVSRAPASNLQQQNLPTQGILASPPAAAATMQRDGVAAISQAAQQWTQTIEQFKKQIDEAVHQALKKYVKQAPWVDPGRLPGHVIPENAVASK